MRNTKIIALYSILFFSGQISYSQSCGIAAINTTPFNQRGSGSTGTSGTHNIAAGALGMYIDFYTLDNSFDITINGKQLATGEINFELTSNLPSTEFAVFSDGSFYGNGTIPPIYGLSGRPLIRVHIDALGNVTIFGARSFGAALELMKLRTGNFNNVGALNIGSTNMVTISQSALGPTSANGIAYGIVEVPQLTADPARTICAGTSITLNANPGYGIWNVDPTSIGLNLSLTNVSPGVATATFNIAAKGLYKFTYTVGTCTVIDTINVTEAVVPSFTLKQYPATVCADSTVTIKIDSAVNTGATPTYSWYVNNIVQQNANAASFTFLTKKGDVVKCEITGSGQCSVQQKAADSLKILFNSSAVLLPDSMKICPGGSTVITASPGFTSYLWQLTTQTSASITVMQPGEYTVTAKDQQGCPSSASVIITDHAVPSDFLAFSDTTICSLGTAKIFARNSYAEYLWNTGSTDSVLQTKNEGLYYLQVKDSNGCFGSDSAYVKHMKCSEILYFPNAFTPNADALNDIFKPTFYGVMHRYELTVYDPWGNLIFTSRNPLLGWDGRMKGNVTAGTYVWHCRFKINDSPLTSTKGTILLMK